LDNSAQLIVAVGLHVKGKESDVHTNVHVDAEMYTRYIHEHRSPSSMNTKANLLMALWVSFAQCASMRING
jgi:hypothetical protein